MTQELPNNLILVGAKYSGKKEYVKSLPVDFVWVETGNVGDIRELDKHTDYAFIDIDNWSPASFSALLTFLEQNEDQHMVLTCRNLMNLPRSIQSRCVVQRMEPTEAGYCDFEGQLPYFSDKMLRAVDHFQYSEEFDFDVFFTVLCNRLLERIKGGENLEREYLICCKYNSAKNLKALNKKQFIVNWELDMRGESNEWQRI